MVFVLLYACSNSVGSYAQLVIDRLYYSRLVVPDHTFYTVEVSDLTIDTLIMDNHSTLKFPLYATQLRVRYAMIGKGCLRDASAPAKGNGAPGRNLQLEVNFVRLGRLTIDTRGGLGMAGHAGRAGVAGVDGSQGGLMVDLVGRAVLVVMVAI